MGDAPTMRTALYLAHPVGGDVHANLTRAMRWLRWLRRSFPETTFVAPWIAAVLSGEDDNDPAQREAGLVDCCVVVSRLDGIVLVGGRVSSGMERESLWARQVYNLIPLGVEPAEATEPVGLGFVEFARALENCCR